MDRIEQGDEIGNSRASRPARLAVTCLAVAIGGLLTARPAEAQTGLPNGVVGGPQGLQPSLLSWGAGPAPAPAVVSAPPPPAAPIPPPAPVPATVASPVTRRPVAAITYPALTSPPAQVASSAPPPAVTAVTRPQAAPAPVPAPVMEPPAPAIPLEEAGPIGVPPPRGHLIVEKPRLPPPTQKAALPQLPPAGARPARDSLSPGAPESTAAATAPPPPEPAHATTSWAPPMGEPMRSVDVSSSTIATAVKSVTQQKTAEKNAELADTSAAVFQQWLAERPKEDDERWNAAPVSEAALRAVLYRAVQLAAERSPQVQEARANWEAALSDVDEVKGQRWPQVDVGTQSRAATFGGNTDASPSRDAAVTLSVVTPIYDFGRMKKTIRSRQRAAEAAAENYEAQLENNASQVTTNAVELAKNRILAQVGDDYITRLRSLVAMLGEIVKVDQGRASELTQAKARLLQAEATRDATLARVRDFELALRKLVGDTLPPLPGDRVWALRPANLDEVLAEVASHPSLQQAQAETESAQLQAEAIKSSAWPQLNWVINKSTGRDAVGREQPWETRLALSWAAFRGGSQRAARSAAFQRAAASQQREGQLRLDLEYQVRSADQDARTLYERADAYRDLTDETERVRKAFFEQWYHLGRRTLLDVLTAESDYYGNQVNEVTSRFDGYNAVFREYSGAGNLVGWLRR